MSSTVYRNRHPERRPQSSGRIASRRTVVLLLLVPLLLAALVPAALYVQSRGLTAASGVSSLVARVHGTPVQPADQFMQSVVTDDGALGWHQLCPSLQAQLPMDQLVQQADVQRTAVAQQGIKLSVQFIGTRSRQGGGALRVYVVTARWPNGTSQTRTFTVLTQPSGCVEDVQNQ